jgi:hypothetical protein
MKKLIALFALLSLSIPALGANVPRLFPDGVAFPATKGLDFSANSNAAGMTSEVLTRYEEGTWTPTIEGSTTAGAATYLSQTGRYTRVGRLVTIHGSVNISAHTGTGAMLITGLPFTSINASGIYAHCGFPEISSLTPTTANAVTFMTIPPNTSILAVTNQAAGAASPNNQLITTDTSFYIWFSCTYTAQ